MLNVAGVELGWQFLRGTSQEMALSCPADHILLHGTRGPGKTDTQLMRFRMRVGLGYGAFWRGIIFDREYKNLDDLVQKSQRWFNDFNDGAEFLSSNSAFKWRWPTGEQLLFRVGAGLNDYWSYHGHEYPFIGFNELTKYTSGEFYEAIQSTNRSGFDPERDTPKSADGNRYLTPNGKPLPPIPLEVFSTTNPYGAGHAWVKRKFINVSEPGIITKTTTKVFDPKTKQDVEVSRAQTHIFSHWSENPNLSPKYIAGLKEQTDENRRRAWFAGDWNINAGGAFADLWHKPTHVIDNIPIPPEWHCNRSFDWGSTHPFSVGWWAEANGEDIEFRGKTYSFVKGSLIRFFEYYGAENLETNVGLKMSAKDIALKIKAYEAALVANGWCGQIYPGPADNQIRNVNEADTETIEKKMADLGVYWEHSDKAKGSRVQGVQLMRDRLQASVLKEGPGIYIMEKCRAFISIVPDLPRDDEKNPDDVLTTSIDHIWDETRYRVLADANRIAKVIKVNFPNSGGNKNAGRS